MKQIFIDESGYTGEDLLNEDQPFFVLASLDLEEAKCKQYKKIFFHEVKAHELKYSSLKKLKKQQEMVLDFLVEFLKFEDNYRISIAHKKYVLVQKLVDFLIEPYMFELGEDLYKNGQNIALSNMLYYCLPKFGGKSFFNNLLTKFQKFMREKSIQNYKELFFQINLVYGDKLLDELLDYVRPADKIIGHKIINLIPPNSLDLSFTFGLNMMAQWRDKIDDEIVLIHDQTSNMTNQVKEWEAVMSSDIDPQILGWDRRILKLPINIKKTRFSSSKDWAGLQLADILAGATFEASCLMMSDICSGNTYGKNLVDILGRVQLSATLFPSQKITPVDLQTIGPKFGDINEKIGEIVYNANHRDT